MLTSVSRPSCFFFFPFLTFFFSVQNHFDFLIDSSCCFSLLIQKNPLNFRNGACSFSPPPPPPPHTHTDLCLKCQTRCPYIFFSPCLNCSNLFNRNRNPQASCSMCYDCNGAFTGTPPPFFPLLSRLNPCLNIHNFLLYLFLSVCLSVCLYLSLSLSLSVSLPPPHRYPHPKFVRLFFFCLPLSRFRA